MREREELGNQCAPAQVSEPLLSRSFISLDRIVEVWVAMQKVPETGDKGSADELLESLEYVEGLLDGIVETGATMQVAFRLPVELVDRLNGYAQRLNSAEQSRRVTLSAVVRQLLVTALAPQVETE
jgi:hypothetical protein